MKITRYLCAFMMLLLMSVQLSRPAYSHAIAGNRAFDGTLTFDDPGVADEVTLPDYSYLEQPAQGSNTIENRIDWSLDRLLTPTLAVTVDSGWIHQDWLNGRTSGFDSTDIGLKYQAYRNNEHETLVAVGVAWGIGHSGAEAVGADAPNTIQPAVFFGKGFGDLPDSLSWLRPFAITGAVVDQAPVGPTSATALAPNLTTGGFQSVANPGVNTLQWGFSIQYSTYYLTREYTGGPPKDEPLNQFVPLVEFSFESPQGQNTAATMNPGFAYIAETYQVATELIVPLNQAGGHGTGFRVQLTIFPDDLLPSVFGKPLLTDKPEVSEIAWH